KGLSRLAPGITAAAVSVEVRTPSASTVRADVALADLRYRSYPSFTRVVIEAGATLAYVVVPGQEEIRIRLPRLTLDRARSEEIVDGLVRDIRLESDGDAAVLRVMLDSKAGEIKTASLQDPFRMVLDVYRPKELSGGEQGATAMEPLRLI